MSQSKFLMMTRQNKKPFAVIPFSASGIAPQDLPESGFGAGLWLLLTGTATATAAATVAPYPPNPWSLVKNLRCYSTDGTELYQTSGWENYIYQKTLRTAFDPAQSTLINFNPSNAVQTPQSRYFSPLVNFAGAGSQTFRCMFHIPFTWGRNWQQGLILLQNTASRYTLEVTWGGVSDLFSVGAANVTLSNTQITPILEFASIPNDGDALPDIAFLKQVKSQVFPITATGTTPYLAPTGNAYTKLISVFENNGAPMDMSKITQITYNYSQTQFPYVENPDQMLWDNRYNYGGDLPAGVYSKDFSLGNGFPEIPTFRDVINTARVTNFEQDFTLDSTLVLTNAVVRQVREQLLPPRRTS